MSALAERAETADGYRARRTLPLRVELVRQLKRRRTLVMGAILALLPFVLVIAFAIGGQPGARNGQVTLTGQLGAVMQESARAALSHVKQQAAALGIPPDFLSKHDLHIHVPAGAIPKDGPSAGVTMATALVSLLLDRPIHPLLAMTGEITLSGNVLPVGGIKEKFLAAKRAGVRDVILPIDVKTNVEEDLSADQIEGVTIHYASRIEDVLDVALPKTIGEAAQDDEVREEVLASVE